MAIVYPRFVEASIRAAFTDTRVVLVTGPRQAGKTTLARRLATDRVPFLTLDDQSTLSSARADPVGFIRGLDRAVIDEAQRAPEILLAIKHAVDIDPRPGRFLLTGSADLMTLPQVADSLAGRIEIVELLPLAQCELRGESCDFLTNILQGKPPMTGTAAPGKNLIDRVLAGGYPEALARQSEARRRKWLLDYARAVIERDVRDIAKIDHARHLPKLLRAVAAQAGQLVNYSNLGAPFGITQPTAQKYVEILSHLYLVRTLQPWYTNALKRLVKTPKLHFLDSALLAALRNTGSPRVQTDRSTLGPLLETFVLGELLKLANMAETRAEFFHFRDRDGHEVDIVIEDDAGHVIGIEVKAAATVTAADFAGLRTLKKASGERFILGLVLYDHDTLVPFGERMYAAPIATLW